MLWVPLNAWTLGNKILAPALGKMGLLTVIFLFLFFAVHSEREVLDHNLWINRNDQTFACLS
jgi:hypothetical protein